MIATSVGVSGLAGCFGSGQVTELSIRNEDQTEHAVRVKATGDFQSLTVEKTVEAEGDAGVEEFIPILDYPHIATITVSVDGTQVTRVERQVEFDIETFTVVVTGPESVRVEPQSAPLTETTTVSSTNNETAVSSHTERNLTDAN
jgi:hypothetical protein